MTDNKIVDSVYEEAQKCSEDITRFFNYTHSEIASLESLLDSTHKVIKKVAKTSDYSLLEKQIAILEGRKPGRRKKVNPVQTNEGKETDKENAGTGRPRRKAFEQATKNVSEQVNMSINAKMRREDVLNASNVVKVERISVPKTSGLMPPPPPAGPLKSVKKKEKKDKLSSQPMRVTRSKMKKELQPPPSVPASSDDTINDVIIQSPKISTIILDSDDEPVQQALNIDNKRIRETPDRKISNKRSKQSGKKARNNSTSDEEYKTPEGKNESAVISSKEIIVQVEKLPNTVASTVPETEQPLLSSTFVKCNSIPKAADTTIVLSKNIDQPLDSTYVMPEKPNNIDQCKDLLTDDESDEAEPTVPKVIGKPGTKEIFNPFENSPVKKRVQAFEKLASSATKLREQSKIAVKSKISSSVAKKATTPVHQQNHPVKAASTSKVFGNSKSTSLLRSEQKTSSQPIDASKRKEALLQQTIEEKRRKRLEKEMRAKEQREQLEKKDLKILEIQKQREERQKFYEAEKQRKLQIVKEEAEKKRLLVKQRQEEIKKEEEKRRLELELESQRKAAELKAQRELESKIAEEKSTKPAYLTGKTPLLPTVDCFDSDEETKEVAKEVKKKNVLPSWVREVGNTCESMCHIDPRFKNTFFAVRSQSIYLPDVFPDYDARKVRRNSSCIWEKDTRFTLMPNLSQIDFD